MVVSSFGIHPKTVGAREHLRRSCAAVREYVVGAAAIARRAYTAQAMGTDAAR